MMIKGARKRTALIMELFVFTRTAAVKELRPEQYGLNAFIGFHLITYTFLKFIMGFRIIKYQ